MDNISFSENYNGHLATDQAVNAKQSTTVEAKEEQAPVKDLQKIVDGFLGNLLDLQHFYKCHPHKYLNDSIISIESGVKSIEI